MIMQFYPHRFYIFLVVTFLSGAATAQTPVRLAAKDSALRGRLVTILKANDVDANQYDSIESEMRIGSSGFCNLQLEQGQYRFEIFDDTTRPALCVRSKLIDVKDSQPIIVPITTVSTSVQVRHAGKKLAIARIAVRSWAPTGEVRLELPHVRAVPLKTSADADLDIMVAAHLDDQIAVGWSTEKVSDSITVQPDPRTWRSRRFQPHPDNPKLASAFVQLTYPRNEIQFPLGRGVTLTSNVPTMQLNYILNSLSRRSLVSRTSLVQFDSSTPVLLGGRLTPSAYAKVMTRLPDQKHLIEGTVLNDAAGREIDLEKSSIHWTEWKTLRGRPVLPKNPLDEVERGIVANPEETMQFAAQWLWVEKRSATFKASPFKKFISNRYSLHAPGGWEGRANIYLTILENTNVAMRQATSRRGPNKTEVRWRLNTHNAKAQVGGWNSWMSMPFKGLRGSKSTDDNPWFMFHEMAHTFGYNHGSKMDQAMASSKAQKKIDRWKIPRDFETGLDSSRVALAGGQSASSDVAAATGTSAGSSIDSTSKRSNVEIIEAVFGTGQRWIDVTFMAAEAYSKGVPLPNSAAGLSVENPAVGKAKVLKIKYRINGEEKLATAASGPNRKVDLRKLLK